MTLRESAPELLRLLAHAAVLDTTAEGVALIDAGGRYAYANARLAQMLGRTPEGLVGLDALELVDEEARDLVRASLARRARGSVEQLDVPLRRADGGRVWVLLALSPLVDERGSYAGALGMMTDITERRRAEAALRLLADATTILSESFEYEVTLANVARAIVPQLAGACTIRLRGGERLESVARYGDAAAGTRLFVPLLGRQGVVGVMTLRSSASRGFDDRDRRLADEIASRAALAVEHARLHRDVKDQRARLRLIADVSRALAGQIDVEGIARAVARAIDGGLAVSFVQPDGGVTTTACASVDSWAEERLRKLLGLKVSLGPGTAGEEALRTRRPVLLRGGAAARLQPPYGAIASELGVDSIIVAPLHLQGRAIGLISASRGPNGAPFRDDDVSLLAEIADRAAMAFERAQLFEQQQRLTERLRLLADAGTLLAQSLQIEPTLTTFARLAVQWFAHACAAVLFDEGGQIAAQAVAASDPALEARVREVVSGYTPNRGSCAPPVLRSVLASGRPHLMARPDADALRAIATDEAHGAALLGLGLRTLIIVPLVARGSPLGTVVMARVRGDAYDEDDLSLAAELGRRAAMAVDNARLFRQATEAIAVRDEFLSIASHELNTPLTPLKMQLDSLRRGSFGPERTAEKLDAASRQVTRLAKLVSELLDVSRISGGRLQLEPERFDLAALVDEIVARVGDEADRAGSCIGVNAERPCFGSWDRMRIDQVVTNLLTNAIKYGDGKPIAIELAHAGADRVRLVVRDHGIGIPPEHQRRIFERFERAASARHYGGFGLGLWITRQIVEASGGTIAVDSQPGNGAAFVVELPRES